MTLLEAVRSGKKFRMTGDVDGEFINSEEILPDLLTNNSMVIVLSADYELEPEETFTVTATELARLWNNVKPGSVAAAESSQFFKRLVAALKGE